MNLRDIIALSATPKGGPGADRFCGDLGGLQYRAKRRHLAGAYGLGDRDAEVGDH